MENKFETKTFTIEIERKPMRRGQYKADWGKEYYAHKKGDAVLIPWSDTIPTSIGQGNFRESILHQVSSSCIEWESVPTWVIVGPNYKTFYFD